MENGERVPRKADLRAFVLMADEPLVYDKTAVIKIVV